MKALQAICDAMFICNVMLIAAILLMCARTDVEYGITMMLLFCVFFIFGGFMLGSRYALWLNLGDGGLPTKEENPDGLYRRYIVMKADETIDVRAEYFVLRLDDDGDDKNHIKACRAAIAVYADEIQEHIPKLAKDIRERWLS